MYYYSEPLLTKSGDVLPGYLVRLFAPNGDAVDIYADNNGTPISTASGIANAAKADDLGMVRFWVPNGTYDISQYDTTDTFKGKEAGVPLIDAGQLTDDLASSSGGAMVGFLQSGTGAVGEALEDTLRSSVGATPMQFGAVGDGVADDTVALGKWLDRGGMLHLPDGVEFKVSNKLTVTQDGTRISGGGKLVYTAAIANKVALAVEADDCSIESITVDNPLLAGTQTGAATYGIVLRGHRNRVMGCHLYGWQHGVTGDVDGEWYDNVVAFNQIDVLGAGDGPANVVSIRGEDRGDGISMFDARSKIFCNTVRAIPGTDARIGIHCEALDSFGGDYSGADSASAAIVIGNHVLPSADGTGRFRRCYSTEGVRRVIFQGNYARGWTWCGLWHVGASNIGSVQGNIFIGDMSPTDQTGAAWSPVKAAILIQAVAPVNQTDTLLANNNIEMRTASSHGIFVFGGTSNLLGNISVRGNKIKGISNMGTYVGVGASDSSAGSVNIESNEIVGGFQNSVYTAGFGTVRIRGGIYDGATDYAINSGGTRVEIDGPTVRNSAVGIQCVSPEGEILRAHFDNVGGSEIVFVTAATAWADGNYDRDGTGTISVFGGGSVSHGRNTGFVTDSRVATTEITGIASRSNTWGKAAGKVLVDVNSVAWVATGAAANSNWKKVEDGSTVTPA